MLTLKSVVLNAFSRTSKEPLVSVVNQFRISVQRIFLIFSKDSTNIGADKTVKFFTIYNKNSKHSTASAFALSSLYLVQGSSFVMYSFAF
ncbi:MAG: hypothetical protein BWY04_00288 [candidate division CPR1 bacterium ADurb.Bin160]|jgi:hypothetical protein|uniref:Uncharacterized protein n=1 Tax=candidate division CPR1 bacterium ADurb.Bin160 TaxID=1852826 RepID=A0A1V5ZQT1_9BACT|nr:MAG: hypothetical protein BWY04_00288 [candidate division CPR1 bacterium ADurb.Bin160]